ncbi:MAG: hypothetical protein WCB86_06610 [Candidatus Dormiibacterota bacterium]
MQIALKGIALGVKPGAEVGSIFVGGVVRTFGEHVIAVEIEGAVGKLVVLGGIAAKGAGSDGVHVNGDVPGLDAINVTAPHGQPIVRTG